MDRPEVLRYKDARLSASGARPMCAEHHMLHADVVADRWDAMLLERGGYASRGWWCGTPCVGGPRQLTLHNT